MLYSLYSKSKICTANLRTKYLCDTEIVRTLAIIKNMKDMAVSTTISGKARLEARLSAEEKEFFERAAALGGFRSLTEFVVRSAKTRAEEIVNRHELVIASKKDSEMFFNSILNPEPPNEKLVAAANKFKKTKNH